MAKWIENWYIDVDSLYHDRLGLAGMLFEACSSLLRQLVSGPAKTHLDALAYRSLRIQADRFSLWGDGVGAKAGTLDKALSDSKNLRRKLIYFLIGCGTCLANLTDQFPNSSQLSKICEEIKILQEQAESAMVDSQEKTESAKKKGNLSAIDETHMVDSLMENLRMSDSESSIVLDEAKEAVEDLKNYVDCLLDLVPALDNPAKDSKHEDIASSSSAGKSLPIEARLFFGEILSRWPSINQRFAQRLAEANWRRCEKLKARLLRPPFLNAVEDESLEELAEDDYPAISEDVSIPTSRSLTLDSPWDHKAPSESSVATSFGEEDSGTVRRGIPKLPEDYEWGATFKCTLCGMFMNIRSPAHWRKHVFDDLRPYVCTDSDCSREPQTFVSQRDWIHHEFTIHRVDKSWACPFCPEIIFNSADLCRKHIEEAHKETDGKWLSLRQRKDVHHVAHTPRIKSQPAEKQECPFCQTVVADKIQQFGTHVGQHFREIAVLAIPLHAYINQGEDLDTYRDDWSDSEIDEFSMEVTLDSGSLLDWIIDNGGVPSLETVRAAYNFGHYYRRCLGTTQFGRQCRERISISRAIEFISTSRGLIGPGKAKSIGLTYLEGLARGTLCFRWHQNQANRIAVTWLAQLESSSAAKSNPQTSV